MQDKRQPISEEKAARIAVGATVAGVLLVLFLVVVLIIQFVQIGVHNRIEEELDEQIARYEQMISDGEGEYFSGGREEQATYLADPSIKICQIWLFNLRTEETISVEFIDQLWLGRIESNGNRNNMLAIRGDSKISRKHCLICHRGNSLYVQDMNSSNHTYLNGQRVTEAATLRNGDVLRIGDTEMKVKYIIAK